MTVKGWEQQPWSEKGMVFRGSGHSRKRLRVMPPGKPLRVALMVAEDKETRTG